jgi:hypothetical protein
MNSLGSTGGLGGVMYGMPRGDSALNARPKAALHRAPHAAHPFMPERVRVSCV